MILVTGCGGQSQKLDQRRSKLPLGRDGYKSDEHLPSRGALCQCYDNIFIVVKLKDV